MSIGVYDYPALRDIDNTFSFLLSISSKWEINLSIAEAQDDGVVVGVRSLA